MNWKNLAANITKGRTVLVLGPDAIPFYPADGKMPENMPQDPSFSQISRRKILKELNGQIKHFYLRDNLFLFSEPKAKRTAMGVVEEIILERQWLPDEELLRKIVAIPFPLILNLNPDKYLCQAFEKYWHEAEFDYFTARNKTGQYGIHHGPDCHEHPVVYNLCGSVLDALDSLILDYYDLFGLLKALLNDLGVSEKVINKLREADQFILLGFQLERWYFQVFLHYLNRLDNDPFNNFNDNHPILSEVGEDSKEFVMKQFNIKHFATSREDFEELYQACQDLEILRNIHDPSSPVVEQIRHLASQGKMEEAFRQFKLCCSKKKCSIYISPFWRAVMPTGKMPANMELKMTLLCEHS